jgi:NADPH-dependent curcumin reductase
MRFFRQISKAQNVLKVSFSTEPLKNLQVRLASRPTGMATRENWKIEHEAVTYPHNDNDILVQVSSLSLDPAMRGWLNDAKSYIRPVGIGEVMRASGV